ncbi:damage-control phosphatase ARMT1 family protein [Streptomyces caniscabiei]|uniref:damage-control phosphatase ARMT1 family protein n=2 Tax=Streptomyces caniscabiei TaxID=2746961 RepID=UPI0029BE61FA|nr:damage-control phosphatase ARMT1 family protein [Streptomyces caniscabiei]MDX2599822.1 damage-control phosphatase ARMT1 family protein [Streptomyces caniscabiei]MDX2734883.1 damage-control phosphatase ARMT1 family protein [Streptomyces caniscabiei]
MPDTAPVIRGDDPASFPHSVLAERHPALVRKVQEATPYGPEQRRALDELLQNTLHGTVAPPADDDWWDTWDARRYAGRSWFSLPFLAAESCFYRQLLRAVGYFDPGPWQGVDPFRPFKLAELDTPEAAAELTALGPLSERPRPEQLSALLHGSLWGNRADLGFRLQSTEETSADSPLVADDSEALLTLLTGPAPGRAGGATGRTLCLVADNAGRELIPDLLLVDHLLAHGHFDRAVLHLKPYPYFVSDATTADTLDAVRHLVTAKTDAGPRLHTALAEGRLILRTHPFSCAPLPYADMPADLHTDFASADLTLMKGDLNYRRLVGDRHWPPTTPFTEATSYFPAPVAALRTLKSDVITGLTTETETTLTTAEDQRWRTSGTRALIQLRT